LSRIDYHDILDLFNTAESVYSTMQQNQVLTSGPDSFRMELPLPQLMATAFAVVTSGRVLELEIHYQTGEKETIRSPKF
jgi:hypothetical protein